MRHFLEKYFSASSRTLLGLMSGTSVDAVDAVLVELDGPGESPRWRLIHHEPHPLPAELRAAVLSLSANLEMAEHPAASGPAQQVALVDSWIGEAFAEAALACLRRAGVAKEAVHLIASHGQTVCHLPRGLAIGAKTIRSTLQLGRGPAIAALTGIPVMSDFRTADFTLGGQGAPLVPYGDRVLFASPEVTRVVQNLGGIGNLTYLPAGDPAGVTAFDTGPANMPVDLLVRQFYGREYDKDGEIARSGKVHTDLLERVLHGEFFSRVPPRSAGHEEFGAPFIRALQRTARGVNVPDLIATVTALGPEAAVRAFRAYLPQFPEEVILCGGGSCNPLVVEHFRRLCPDSTVHTSEDFGIAPQAKEGLAFAIIADATMYGIPSNVPAATGASGPAMLGSLSLPPPRGS